MFLRNSPSILVKQAVQAEVRQTVNKVENASGSKVPVLTAP